MLEEVSLDESRISQLEELLRDAPMRMLEVTTTGTRHGARGMTLGGLVAPWDA